MTKYFKRSKLCDAFLWEEHNLVAYPDWLKLAIINGTIYFINLGTTEASMKITLTSGKISHAYFGDWIVHEPQGSIHAMKADAFLRTYELAPLQAEVADLL